MEVSEVIGVPPVIIHFWDWDFPSQRPHPAIGYHHGSGTPLETKLWWAACLKLSIFMA